MTGVYDIRLVLLSIVIAVFASYTALDLTRRVTAERARAAKLWLYGGAVAMGTGIWAMHFVGMLAFQLPIRMGYDPGITLLSMGIAILVSGFALWIASRKHLPKSRLLMGGTLMGAGIAAMHYTGMAAMLMFPAITYDPVLFSASLVIAASASVAALWIAFALRTPHASSARLARLGAAMLMGCAIAGMHYTGMAAAEFGPNSVCRAAGDLNNAWLAITIAVISLSVLAITLVLSIVDARLAERTRKLSHSLDLANSELQALALHDPLTKLPNRLLLEDRIERVLAHSNRHRQKFAILFLDLDRFKSINDSFGHHVGDEVLKLSAQRLAGCLRADDSVARLGGDEFVVVLPEVNDETGALAVAHKMLEQMSTAFHVQGHELRISTSIGMSFYPRDGDSAHELLVNADAAMYYVKQSGRNDVQCFEPGMSSIGQERLELEAALREALARDRLELHYQPKVNIMTGKITGVEALCRWIHPQRGPVPPSEFIPLAEDCGLIVSLGTWVLRTACRQASAWQSQGLSPIRVAVNLSAAQFKQRNLLAVVTAALRETGLHPQWLELEITESAVMQNPEAAARTLTSLAEMGVHIAIDDFGTGYSSLSYLKRFPIRTLKIDRSFIRDLTTSPHDPAIVRAVVALAHSLGLDVVAEGVENVEQLDYLRQLDGDEYQGFLCSRPLPAGKLSALLQEYLATSYEAARGGRVEFAADES